MAHPISWRNFLSFFLKVSLLLAADKDQQRDPTGDDGLAHMKKEDEHDVVHDPDMHDHHDVHDPDVPNVDTGFMEV